VAGSEKTSRLHIIVQRLTLAVPPRSSSEAAEALHAVASAIQLDRNLADPTLKMEDGFADKAGVALTEQALTVNTSLRRIILSTTVRPDHQARTRATLGAPAFRALRAMLRINTSLVRNLPPFESDGADERLLECQKQMRIEQRLNQVGREKLVASRQTTEESSMSMPCTS
jgi:hypothetical protein